MLRAEEHTCASVSAASVYVNVCVRACMSSVFRRPFVHYPPVPCIFFFLVSDSGGHLLLLYICTAVFNFFFLFLFAHLLAYSLY